MEEYKYLPPKYSYSLKDLASDYGVYERMDVQSVHSGSSNLTMTTASGFNVGGGDRQQMDPPLRERDIGYPLSPIKETRAPQPGKHANSASAAKHHTSPGGGSFKNQLGTNTSRFKNPVYFEMGQIPTKRKQPSTSGAPLSNRKPSPRRERSSGYESGGGSLSNFQV